MLLILMYHRAGDRRDGTDNTPVVLAEHFRHLRERAVVVLPGEPLQPRRLNVCLTFDDGFADFYFHVFPLLQQFSLRALLAVSTKYILEETALAREIRLAVDQAVAMENGMFQTRAPFCTWKELREMQASGLVQIASHSHSHQNMRSREIDADFEAAHSRQMIEKNLGSRPGTFIYPYGSVNARARQAVRRQYEFDMRIGSALNLTWHPPHQPLCRLPADDTPDLAKRLRWNRLAGPAFKMVGNQARAMFGKWRTD